MRNDSSACLQDGRLDIKLRRLNSADLLVFPDTAQVCTRSWSCRDAAVHRLYLILVFLYYFIFNDFILFLFYITI